MTESALNFSSKGNIKVLDWSRIFLLTNLKKKKKEKKRRTKEDVLIMPTTHYMRKNILKSLLDVGGLDADTVSDN